MKERNPTERAISACWPVVTERLIFYREVYFSEIIQNTIQLEFYDPPVYGTLPYV